MFGYFKLDKNSPQQLLNHYRKNYCYLCRSLGKHYSEQLIAFIYFGCVAVGMAVLKSITARKIYQVYSKKFEAFDKNLI